MWKVQARYRTHDSARTALVTAGIALVVGGAALFGIIAHTKIPFRLAGTSPPDNLVFVGPPAPATPQPVASDHPIRGRPVELLVQSRSSEPPPAEADIAETMPVEPPPPKGEAGTVLVDSLTRGETVVLLPKAPSRLMVQPPQPTPPVVAGTKIPEAARTEAKIAENSPGEPKPVVVRVADVKIVGPKAQEVRLVESKVKAAEPRRVEPKPAPTKVAEAKRAEPKPAATKVAEAKHVDTKREEAKRIAEAKVAEAKAAEARRAEAKRVAEAKAAEKIAETKRAAEARATEARLAEVRRAEVKRVAEAKAAEAKIAEAKRAADAKAAELKVAEARRAAKAKAAETKLAEARRASDLKAKAAEWKLADTKRAAEAEQAKLAEAKRDAETKAAEAKLAETRRAVEQTVAEAKAAEAKLAETKRAIETTLAQARQPEFKPAVETRTVKPSTPAWAWCDTCGTIISVVTRYLDRGTSGYEVRVNFRDGSKQAFIYPTNPGFVNGDRVRLEAGRLMRMASSG